MERAEAALNDRVRNDVGNRNFAGTRAAHAIERMPFDCHGSLLPCSSVGAYPFRKTGVHFSGICANVVLDARRRAVSLAWISAPQPEIRWADRSGSRRHAVASKPTRSCPAFGDSRSLFRPPPYLAGARR